MHCPACKTATFTPIELDLQLPAQQCSSCQGHWLVADDYFTWLDRQPTRLPEKPYEGEPLQLSAEQTVKICPTCIRIMHRYDVGHDTAVTLDQCAHCDGIWFDHDEWQALKGRNLHDEIHLVFTAPWQAQLRKTASIERLKQIYGARFGADFARLQEIHAWLHTHPQKDDLLAFLSDPTPFEHHHSEALPRK
jgi:Zn-finger nucleic acid-binding protein